MKILNCVDCGAETECEWCEVCVRPVCDECDLSHDCVSEHLADDEEDYDSLEDDAGFEEDDDTDCGNA